MKRLVFCWILLTLTKITVGQKLEGMFRSGDEFLRFSKDSVSFYLKSGGCILYEYKGDGTYHLSKKHLLIQPLIDEKPGKVLETKRAKEDTLTLTIYAEDVRSPVGASVLFYSKGKMILASASNGDNIVQVSKKYLSAIDSVTINSIGYSFVAFKMSGDKDYKVTLVKSKRKADFEAFLLTNQKGFDVKLEGGGVRLKRQLPSCKQKKYHWRTFIPESTSHNISFEK